MMIIAHTSFRSVWSLTPKLTPKQMDTDAQRTTQWTQNDGGTNRIGRHRTGWTLACLTLDEEIEVRILVPQPLTYGFRKP